MNAEETKKTKLTALHVTVIIALIQLGGLWDVRKGKVTWLEWWERLPLIALVMVLLIVSSMLGQRAAHRVRGSFRRGISDIVGCLGLIYLYLTTVKVQDAPPGICWILALMALSLGS